MPQEESVLEQLRQIFGGATWDGDLISKRMRDRLVKEKMVEQVKGWNIITAKGALYLIDLNLVQPHN
jgi:hypothetical protein